MTLLQMFDLPSPKNISNSFFDLTRPDTNLINEESATYEGVVDEERNVALVQWSQFIEHDLVKTVFQIMSAFQFYTVKKGSFLVMCFLSLPFNPIKVMAIQSNVVKRMQQMLRHDIVIQHAHLLWLMSVQMTIIDYLHV